MYQVAGAMVHWASWVLNVYDSVLHDVGGSNSSKEQVRFCGQSFFLPMVEFLKCARGTVVVKLYFFLKNPMGPLMPGSKFLRVTWVKQERRVRPAVCACP